MIFITSAANSGCPSSMPKAMLLGRVHEKRSGPVACFEGTVIPSGSVGVISTSEKVVAVLGSLNALKARPTARVLMMLKCEIGM